VRQRPLFLLLDDIFVIKSPFRSVSFYIPVPVSESKPLVTVITVIVPLLRLGVAFLLLFKGTLLANFNKIVERED
jgi:hypothetical protein